MPRRGKERCRWSPLWSSLRRAESGGFTQNLGAKNKVPAPKRCHAFVSNFLHCLYTCLLRLLGLVGWVGWGNNVLALPYLMYFSCAYVIHLGWGWLTWGGLGQQRPCTCVLNILFLCLHHALEFGLVDLRWVVTFLHLRRISISWCYVTRTSLDSALDFMLRYVGVSYTSYITSSYVVYQLVDATSEELL
jgi:hypothetical protein